MQIPARYNGPPGSGNGGWSAGAFAVASGIDGVVEVTLRSPPPLDTPLTRDDTAFTAPDGTLVATVAAADGAGDPVPAASFDEAVVASTAYPGFADHPFPACYVCGPQRPDGLRLFPGRLPDGRNAAPWRVPDDVVTETMWAALDCPGGWSTVSPPAPGPPVGAENPGDGMSSERPYLLGRLAVAVEALPAPGSDCVVVGVTDEMAGRKAFTRSTVYGPDGAPLATARATWIRLGSVR